jgi:hypothetical protein
MNTRRCYEHKEENIFSPLVQLLMFVSGISLFYNTMKIKVCVTDRFIVNMYTKYINRMFSS